MDTIVSGKVSEFRPMPSFRSSWAAAQPGCSAAHRPERWSLQTAACSVRRYGWPTAVPRDDAGLLVITGSVSGQLQNFRSQVLHHGGQIDRCATSDTLGVVLVSLAKQTVDTTDRKLQSSTSRTGLCLGSDFSFFATSRHLGDCLV